MEKEIVERFLNKFVKLERQNNDYGRPFNLHGVIREVTEESVLIYTDCLGAIPLSEIISIREEKPKERRHGN